MLLRVPQVFSILPYTCSLGGLCNQVRNCDTVHLFLLWMRVRSFYFFFLTRYDVGLPWIRQGKGCGGGGWGAYLAKERLIETVFMCFQGLQ